MRVAAVCAIYGGYDLIPPVPEGFDDCVLVTDVPVLSGWRNVVRTPELTPMLDAKYPKMRPDLFTDCDASLWMDGSVHVRDGRFAALVRDLLASHEIVLWDHPEDRDCLYQEAQHCHSWPKYADVPLLEQVEHYRAEGMPEHFGLWAATCIARRHTPSMLELGDAWLAEQTRWSHQDQVSLPYLLWRMQVVPGTFGVDQLDNDLVDWVPHAAEVRAHRTTVLGLEYRILELEAEMARLRDRRAVRAALRLAGWVARLTRWIRRPG